VASYAPNTRGLHDLLGNVWEWTADEHCPYPESSVSDPLARCGAELRVIRGGSWYFGADSARCALRYTHRPVDRGPSLGLRVVREDPAARGAAGPPTRGEP
jgi:formylglycine-generating enzyme required for sulfatase activity